MNILQRSVLVPLIAVLLSVSSVMTLSSNFASASSKVTNANFKGTWTAGTGGWVIKSENAKTGACTGTSDFGPSYHFLACRVTGSNYVFAIKVGSYVSHNSGTIHGNHVVGEFHDTNGSSESYTATRK